MSRIKEAVILCAGRSTRTYPLTLQKPKPMLKVANRRILEHLLIQLDGLIEHAVIVIGFEGHQITAAFGKGFSNIKITYVEQIEQKGTGDALLAAEGYVGERFIMLNGDDLLERGAIELLLNHELCLLASPHAQPWRFGVIKTEGEFVREIVEKPMHAPPNSLVSTGAYALTNDIFELLKSKRGDSEGEFMFTDVVAILARSGLRYEVTEGGWMPVTYPWDILLCTDHLMGEMKGTDIRGQIGRGVNFTGVVKMDGECFIGHRVVIHGPCILGDGVHIGERTIIRSCSIGNSVRIGSDCELEGCVIYDGAQLGDGVRMKRSVIGENARVGDGTLTVTKPKDSETVISIVKGEPIDTGLKELGVFIGDGATIGMGCTFMAGVKVWSGALIPDGQIVDADVILNA